MPTGHWIDTTHWRRAEHFRLFRAYAQPHFSVTAEVDVSALRGRCKAPGGPSFFLATLFLSLAAANAVPAFRLRLRGERVWCHDVVDAGCTVLRPDDTFTFASYPCTAHFADFAAAGEAENTRRRAAPGLLDGGDGDELIHYSVLPWVAFTSFTNALPGPDESCPKIVFGRYTERAGRWVMPVSVQVHHALVDGIDVGRFFEGFQQRLDAPVL